MLLCGQITKESKLSWGMRNFLEKVFPELRFEG